MKINTNLIIDIIKKNSIDTNRLSKISKKIQIDKLEELQEIELTFNQVKKLSKELKVPFGSLFLEKYTRPDIPIPDFRSKDEIDKISLNLQKSINNSLLKQSWYRDYLIRIDSEKFVCNALSDAEIIDFIKEITNFKYDVKTDIKELVNNLEKLNILVIISGISDNSHTKDTIKLNEARGYAIYDDYAPLIFINTNDSEKGKIFTLFHELAHIMLSSSGISSYVYNTNNDIEQRCNSIAGEILMPNFKWDKNKDIESNINIITNIYPNASKLAIATKALINKYISYDNYKNYKKLQLEELKTQKKPSGGDYFNTTTSRNSKLFTKIILTQTLNGHETYRNAMNLLDIKSLKIFDSLVSKNLDKNSIGL